MINIAYVVHSLQAGGIERSVTRIVNRLDRDEFNPTIICLEKSGPAEQWLEWEVPIVEIGKKSGNDVMAVRRLSRVLRERQIDIVQSHNWGTLIESMLARRVSRTPFHIHAERGTVLGMVEAKGLRHWLRARAMAYALSHVNCVISNSHAVALRVQARCGYSAERIEVIPNGVPELSLDDRRSIRDQVRSQLGLNPESILVGSVGRLVEVKGFEFAIRAMANLSSRDVHLVLVGDGPEREKLSSLSEELGVTQNVHFVGRQENVDHWLVAMDIYLNSSLSEGMSQSIIEAMAAGLPIVATDVGDTKRVLGLSGQRAGVCVPAADDISLANTLELMTNDTKMRERHAAQSRLRHAGYFTEETLTTNCQNLYRATVGEGKARVGVS